MEVTPDRVPVLAKGRFCPFPFSSRCSPEVEESPEVSGPTAVKIPAVVNFPAYLERSFYRDRSTGYMPQGHLDRQSRAGLDLSSKPAPIFGADPR